MTSRAVFVVALLSFCSRARALPRHPAVYTTVYSIETSASEPVYSEASLDANRQLLPPTSRGEPTPTPASLPTGLPILSSLLQTAAAPSASTTSMPVVVVRDEYDWPDHHEWSREDTPETPTTWVDDTASTLFDFFDYYNKKSFDDMQRDELGQLEDYLLDHADDDPGLSDDERWAKWMEEQKMLDKIEEEETKYQHLYQEIHAHRDPYQDQYETGTPDWGVKICESPNWMPATKPDTPPPTAGQLCLNTMFFNPDLPDYQYFEPCCVTHYQCTTMCEENHFWRCNNALYDCMVGACEQKPLTKIPLPDFEGDNEPTEYHSCWAWLDFYNATMRGAVDGVMQFRGITKERCECVLKPPEDWIDVDDQGRPLI